MGVVTVPASADRMEHVSLLRHHLEPEHARDARVTKQSVLPVTTFLMCAALFFTACVGVLVVGARPDVPGGGRVVSISSLREAEVARNRAIDAALVQDSRWFDQGRPLDRITVYHDAERLTQRDQEDFDVAPGFDAWRGAPFWQHFHEIPVSYNRPAREMSQKSLVVVGHATDRAKTPLWTGSIARHKLAAAATGEGTWWHDGEDKIMGLKAALLRLGRLSKIGGGKKETYDPVVVFSDASDSLFSCDETEMLERFESMGADVVVSATARCHRPDGACAGGAPLPRDAEPDAKTNAAESRVGATRRRSNVDASDERRTGDEGNASKPTDAKETGSRRRVDAAPAAAKTKTNAKVPRAWADAGALVGRRSKLLELVEELESFLVRDPRAFAARGKGLSWGKFYRECAPVARASGSRSNATVTSGLGFDDQACLNRYVAEKAKSGDTRVVMDFEGKLLRAVGTGMGTGTGTGTGTGRAWGDAAQSTQAPCVWHFDGASRANMRPMIVRFPGTFV